MKFRILFKIFITTTLLTICSIFVITTYANSTIITCPRAIGCTGNTIKSCSASDGSWSRIKVQMGKVHLGIYEFVEAVDVRYSDTYVACIYQSISSKLAMIETTRYDLTSNNVKHTWDTRGPAFLCTKHHKFIDPSYCPLKAKQKH